MYSWCVARSVGERAGLSREQVLGAALAVLRSDGLAAVSMRRVADALGVAPNALYSHVPDKSALVDGVLDLVLGEIDVPARGGWRTRVEAVLADTRRVLLRYPDLVPLVLGRQSVGPNALRLGETLLEQLHRAGLGEERAVPALQLLLVHTIGATAFEVPRLRDPDPEARAARAQAASAGVDPVTHPRTAALAAPLARHAVADVFALGLRLILDGLTAEAARG